MACDDGRMKAKDNLEWWHNTATEFANELEIQPPSMTLRGYRTRLVDGITHPRVLTVDAHTLGTHTRTNAGRWMAARAMVVAQLRQGKRGGDGLLAKTLGATTGALLLAAFYSTVSFGYDSTALALTIATLVALALTIAVGMPALSRLRSMNRTADTRATALAGRDAAGDYLRSGGDLHRTALHRILAGEDTTDTRVENLALAGTDG